MILKFGRKTHIYDFFLFFIDPGSSWGRYASYFIVSCVSDPLCPQSLLQQEVHVNIWRSLSLHKTTAGSDLHTSEFRRVWIFSASFKHAFTFIICCVSGASWAQGTVCVCVSSLFGLVPLYHMSSSSSAAPPPRLKGNKMLRRLIKDLICFPYSLIYFMIN